MRQQSLKFDNLTVHIVKNEEDMAIAAAKNTGEYLQSLLASQAEVTMVLATGRSQLLFLDQLITSVQLDWSRITLFHLDEYLGIAEEHPGSFRHYLREKVEKRIKPKEFHYLQGDTLQPFLECQRYAQLLQNQPLDLCCLGVGINGHLAFNEPSVANFEDSYWVKLVKLEETTRLAQIQPGIFADLEAVPQYAFTMTIPAIFSAHRLLCLCPKASKAKIIQEMLHNPINSNCPASFLRQHPQAELFLDFASASLLEIE